MAPRQRKGKSKGLPPHLYANRSGGRVYYRYRDENGAWHSLGTDRREAIRQAQDANLRRSGAGLELSQRIDRRSAPTIGSVVPEYIAWRERRGAAENTLRTAKSQLRSIQGELGDVALTDLTTRHCAEYLNSIREQGKDRLAQALRSTLKSFLQYCISQGYITDNVALHTAAERVETKRGRLTLDTFLAVHAAASRMDPWLQRAMELALVSGQPREVVAAAMFRDVSDGAWWCRRGKTGAQIMLPLELTCEPVGWSLDEVVRACRDRVVSPHMIHHTRPKTLSKPGDSVHPDTISRRFAAAREKAGITGPTFHEIRSLAERLYHDQGLDTQALLGHKDPRTTAMYHDARGAEWVRVKV